MFITNDSKYSDNSVKIRPYVILHFWILDIYYMLKFLLSTFHNKYMQPHSHIYWNRYNSQGHWNKCLWSYCLFKVPHPAALAEPDKVFTTLDTCQPKYCRAVPCPCKEKWIFFLNLSLALNLNITQLFLKMYK